MKSKEQIIEIYRSAILQLVRDVEQEDPIVVPVAVQHMKNDVLEKVIADVSSMIYHMVNEEKDDLASVMFVLAATTAKVMTENFGVMYGRLKELPDQQYVQMFNSWIDKDEQPS